MCLPLIIFGGLFLVQIIRNWNGVNDITIDNIQMMLYETASLFLIVGNGAVSGLLEGFNYFLEILGVTESNSFPYLLVMAQIVYMVVIELIWLLYDLIIFIPRACRSIVERGM